MPPTFRHPLRALLALAALAPGLGGCMVGPDHAAPDPALPPSWTVSPRGAPVAPAWWRTYRDPTLDRLISTALANGTDVEAARARVRQARAARTEAASALQPTGDFGSTTSRSRLAGTESSLYQGGLDAGWEIDLFGGIARSVEASQDGLDASVADLHGVRLSMASEVARNYSEARGYQARISAARRTVASLRSTETLVRGRLDAGLASEVDALKAKAQAESTAADIPVLDAAYRQAAHRIGTLTGDGPTAALAAMSRGRGILHAPRRSAGIPADVVRARPDIRKAERLLAQSSARIGVAEADLYPALRLGGSLNLSAASLAGLGGAAATGWSLGPTLSLPLLDGGRRQAVVAGAEAKRDEAMASYRGAVLAAMEEVENAVVAGSRERTRVASLTKALAAQRQAASLSRELYARGAASFLDVLDAERSLYTAEASLIQSQVLVVTDDIALCKALGGGEALRMDSGDTRS